VTCGGTLDALEDAVIEARHALSNANGLTRGIAERRLREAEQRLAQARKTAAADEWSPEDE
jgi:hypothetical protein